MSRRRAAGFAFLALAVAVAVAVAARANADWRTASRAPVGIAPQQAEHPEAPVQVYGARTVGWRGTCLTYALLHLALALPLCLAALPREAVRPGRPAQRGRPGAAADRRFWLIAVAAMAVAAIMSAWSVHVVTILRAEGMSLAAAVGAAASVLLLRRRDLAPGG